MNIQMTVKECEEIGHVHYLLASGIHDGAAGMSESERRALLEKARHWFERAFIYGGGESCQRFADFCEQQLKDLRPTIYAIAS